MSTRDSTSHLSSGSLGSPNRVRPSSGNTSLYSHSRLCYLGLLYVLDILNVLNILSIHYPLSIGRDHIHPSPRTLLTIPKSLPYTPPSTSYCLQELPQEDGGQTRGATRPQGLPPLGTTVQGDTRPLISPSTHSSLNGPSGTLSNSPPLTQCLTH